MQHHLRVANPRVGLKWFHDGPRQALHPPLTRLPETVYFIYEGTMRGRVILLAMGLMTSCSCSETGLQGEPDADDPGTDTTADTGIDPVPGTIDLPFTHVPTDSYYAGRVSGGKVSDESGLYVLLML